MDAVDCFDQTKSSRHRAELAMLALGLDLGSGFGLSYYESLYRILLKLAFDAYPTCSSFTELREALAQSAWRDFRSGDDADLLARVNQAAADEAN